MLWGRVLSEYVLGDGDCELGGCGAVGVGVEEMAGEGYCCLKACDLRLSGFGIGDEFALETGTAAYCDMMI